VFQNEIDGLPRKLADQKGIHVAMKQNGHRSDRYIWRCTQPSDEELQNGEDDLE
jgi:hypothetical protein